MHTSFDINPVLSLVDHDKETATALLSMFLEQTPADLDMLHNYLQNSDWEGVYKTAHKMKSGVRTLGLKELGENLFNLEQQCRSLTNLEQVPEAVTTIRSQLERVFAGIQALLDKGL
jgi:HPt (histidine-containing phosphotransfer) domain-containing protein